MLPPRRAIIITTHFLFAQSSWVRADGVPVGVPGADSGAEGRCVSLFPLLGLPDWLRVELLQIREWAGHHGGPGLRHHQ